MATAYDQRVGEGGISVLDMTTKHAVVKLSVDFSDYPLAANDILKVLNLPANWVPSTFLYNVADAATDTATMTVDVGINSSGTTVGTEFKSNLDMKTEGWAGATPTALPTTTDRVIAVKADHAITTGQLDLVFEVIRVN